MSLDRFDPVTDNADLVPQKGATSGVAAAMVLRAAEVAAFLKAMSHEGRLMILCYLADAERSVTELEMLLGQRQAAVSQQLARLRLEGLVTTRREGKAIFYSIRDPKVRALMQSLRSIYLLD